MCIDANAWQPAQASWHATAIAEPTTYTFVDRHEPDSAPEAPGVTPSQQIIGQHPYTLLIVGHTHTFRKSGSREVIVGNGGAPISGTTNYGFALVTQRADGAVQVGMIDYQTGQL